LEKIGKSVKIVIRVAITGGIAAGKSTVCHIFQELGAYVVSADHIVHEIYSQNLSYKKQVIALLGQEIVTDGEIDRKKVAEIVFSKAEKLRELEKLIHPLVNEEIDKQYEKVKHEKKYNLFVVEFPLLYEIEAHRLYDYVITVHAEFPIAKKRFLEKGGKTEDFEKRQRRFMSQQEKVQKADFVITNSSDFSELKAQVKQIYKQILTQLNS